MSQSFHIAFNDAMVFENHPVSRITCITCWGKFLVVGTEKGHLLIYDFIPESMKWIKPSLFITIWLINYQGTGFKVEIKGSFTEFSKKPIDQLSIHEGHNLMIMLSGFFSFLLFLFNYFSFLTVEKLINHSRWTNYSPLVTKLQKYNLTRKV